MMGWWKHLAALSLAMAVSVASAQNDLSQDQMKEWLNTARHRSQLLNDDVTPFHLVASYEQFDASGKVVGRGSIDELWQNPRRYRQTLTVPEIEEVKSATGTSFQQQLKAPPRKLVEVDNGTQLWRTGRWIVFAEIAGPVLQPLSQVLQADGRLSMQQAPPGSSGLNCIGWEPRLEDISEGIPVALSTVCLAQGNHLLKLTSQPNGTDIAFNDVQPFGGRYIARSVKVFVRKKLVISIHIDGIEAASNFTVLDMPPPSTAQLIDFHRADRPFTTTSLMEGQLYKKVSPQYPSGGFTGTITVKCHVNIAGEVESEEILAAQDPTLRAPVFTALKAWRFRVSYQSLKPMAVDHVYRFSFGKEEEIQ